MATNFVKLALLLDDDFGLVLAHECLKSKPKSKPAIFNLHSYDEKRCKQDFRFYKSDLYRLQAALKIPKQMQTSSKIKFSGDEGLCLLLRRLAYPNRLMDLQGIFGRCKQDLSLIFNYMLDFVHDNYYERISSFEQWWLNVESLNVYANAIRNKGCPLDGCFGFIDGTIQRICRPRQGQKEVYSGHKRVHGLKYQSIVLPNGLIANLYGPESGRRHDSYMLHKSNVLPQLQNIIGDNNLYLYGDSGYPLKRHLITPHLGTNLSPEKQLFNVQMSKVRISVEWEFGELFEQFAFLLYKYNQKINLQPVAKYMRVATILKNCQTCLYGCQTSIYFSLTPPTLESYLHNNVQL